MAKWTHLLDNILANFPEDKPVFMLNLLQFYDQAQYTEGSTYSPCSGQEAIVRYATEFRILATEAGGFELAYLGLRASYIIFRKTLGSDDYAATAVERRDAALKDWKLIASFQTK
ncbi:hypothetical protein BDW68DRAFT_183631 [Aspergillus falconensis]